MKSVAGQPAADDGAERKDQSREKRKERNEKVADK